MKKKILGLIGLSILALLLISLVSAALTLTLTSSPEVLTKFKNSTSFTISTGTTQVNFTTPTSPFTIKDLENNIITLTVTNATNLNNVTQASFDVDVTNIPSDFNFGKYLTNLAVYAENVSDSDDNSTIQVPITFENTPCEYEDNGNLKIKIKDISVNGFGKKDKWFPLDEIEVEIEVENDGNEEIEDIIVKWGLYNKKIGDWIIDDEEKDFDLNKNKKKLITINFKLDDPDEFEDEGDYVFYVWATGEDKEFDGNKTCTNALEGIDIIIEDDFVILDNIQFPETTSCGSEVQITANVWNIGDEEQDEVYVVIYNQELGINEKVVIGDIDAFEDEKLDTLIKIPQGAEEKYYTLTFYVYNEDNEVYENDNDDEAKFSLPLKIEGNCIFDPKLTITASLVSGGKAGEELVVKAVLKNTDSKTRTFSIEAGNYNSWAELVGLEPTSLTLNAGESKEVLLTFNVNRDVSGEQTFNILVSSDNKLIATQPTSVSIEKSGFDFTGITGAVISKENWYLWGIGALNIILVIIIIVVAVRLARKK